MTFMNRPAQTISSNSAVGFTEVMWPGTTTVPVPIPPASTCPNCGYCPYCGRGGYPTYPLLPMPSYPYPTWGYQPIWRWLPGDSPTCCVTTQTTC